jgi:hypothetical protein
MGIGVRKDRWMEEDRKKNLDEVMKQEKQRGRLAH